MNAADAHNTTTGHALARFTPGQVAYIVRSRFILTVNSLLANDYKKVIAPPYV